MAMTLEARVPMIEEMFGYVFVNKALCAEAIQMAMPEMQVVFDGAYRTIRKNNLLAVVGDISLNHALCKMWYSHTHSTLRQTSTAWTQARNDLASNAALATRGNSLGLGPLIYVTGGYYGPASDKMIATTIEAIIGAIDMDGGEPAVVEAVKHLGFDDHPSLMVTSQLSPLHMKEDIMLLTELICCYSAPLQGGPREILRGGTYS